MRPQPVLRGACRRTGGGRAGALPSSTITYNLAGPVNHGAGWFPRDNNNFGPRLSIAWTPDGDGFLTSLLGKGSVIRAGAGVVYDHYGNTMATTFATSGSPGLASQVSQLLNTDFTTAFRYSGGALPALPAPPAASRTRLPPWSAASLRSAVSRRSESALRVLCERQLRAELPKKMTIEVGYIGRLSHKGLMQQDFAQPLTGFKDVKSGQTWTQASTAEAHLR